MKLANIGKKKKKRTKETKFQWPLKSNKRREAKDFISHFFIFPPAGN